jgi:muconolactone delta-isomerase
LRKLQLTVEEIKERKRQQRKRSSAKYLAKMKLDPEWVNRQKAREHVRGIKRYQEQGAAQRKWQMTPEYKAYRTRTRYKLTEQEFDEVMKITHCCICGEPAVHIDHNHSTGKVRGRLCHLCNMGLGSFKDSAEKLQKAIEYLKH